MAKDRPFKILAAIADIHIGIKHISPDSFIDQLNNHFFKPLNELKYLDAILVLGDVLHTIVSLNSEHAKTFHWFISKLYQLGQDRRCPVVIIKGTISHDNDQLDTIKNYQYWYENKSEFIVIDKVTEFELWKGFKVLALPDVKVKELKDIDKYLDNTYDMIIGHGVVDAMRFFSQESESTPTKTYVYDSDKLMSCSRGPVLFGHIHQFQHIRNKFYYVGPFTLLERGGHNAGFAIVGIDNKDHTRFKVEHYINTDSARYFNIDVTKDILSDGTIEELFEAIDEIIEEANPHDLITLRITRGDELEDAEKVLSLESRYKPDKRISIVKKIKTKKEEEREKENAEKIQKYSYIGQKESDMAEIMYRYYTEDVKPRFTDPECAEANLTLEDFRSVLK